MICNAVLLNVRHPMRFLPENNKIYLGLDGKTEVLGPGYHDSRPRWCTFVDPFDVAGLVSGRDGKDRFWENDMAEREREEGRAVTEVVCEAGTKNLTV